MYIETYSYKTKKRIQFSYLESYRSIFLLLFFFVKKKQTKRIKINEAASKKKAGAGGDAKHDFLNFLTAE